MPAGSRIRANNVYGTVSNNPLLIGDVSLTSLGLSLLPPVSGEHAVLVLDPKRVFGEPEIVVVTSHLAMGTTATITRGTYGTIAREHPQGTPWAHVPVGPDDYTAIVTSGTRPSDPYPGQMIFETDTDLYSGYNGSGWVTVGSPVATSPYSAQFQANPPACRLRKSTNQTINSNTLTLITWDLEDYDTDGMHSTVLNTDRITINTPGIYLFTSQIAWSTDTDITEVLIRFLINGVTGLGQVRLSVGAGASGVQQQNAVAVQKLAATDFVSVEVRQINTNAGTNSANLDHFSATWLGIG